MKIGIIGLPQTGKKTLFRLLTNHTPTENELISNKPINGIAEIKDPRIEQLAVIYKPQKQVMARVQIELFPKIEKDSIVKGEIFKDIEEVDGLCHIVRAFKDESIYHISGSVDPRRDIDMINTELILNDLLFIEKRLERIDTNLKKRTDKVSLGEKELLIRLKAHLDKELPLRLLDLSLEEERVIASYPLVTRKSMFLVLNVSEDDLKDSLIVDKLKQDYGQLKIDAMQISARLEAEIVELESEEEKEEFLKVLGISEPAINQLTRLCIRMLNLVSFFTIKSDEARQWLIRQGSSALEAAGIIHTDMQKGFIRAEVIKYDDLISYGNEDNVRHAGKLYLKGKDYIVEDGDILTIRFNI